MRRSRRAQCPTISPGARSGHDDGRAVATVLREWHNSLVRPLTTDLGRVDERPYFLWDEDTSVAEFRRALAAAPAPERIRLVGKLMREARDTDVWTFVTPREVWAEFPSIQRYLGRRRPFWTYLLHAWHRDGIVG